MADAAGPFAPLRPEAGALPAAVVAQAADWRALLQSGSASAAQEEACAVWRAADARHELAWQRLAAFDDELQAGTRGAHAAGAPAAREALHAVAQRMARRRMGRWALGLAGTGAVAWQLREHTPWPALAAAHRTATGERRSLMLEDGTQLQIASASAVDVHFTGAERRILLHAGEVLVQSGHGDARPLRVQTREGSVAPVGTRFTVRHDDAGGWGTRGCCTVAVLQGAVDVQAGQGDAVRVVAGRQARFGADGVTPPTQAPADVDAWVDDMLVADRMPLADFVAALARWRPGVLRCAPEAAALRITGAFPLDDTDRALAMLVRILPVRVAYRTRWWVTVQAS
ncbi:FecR domain-containing protein [Pseudorhodoferax sp. LjRoot39]|uniref:FecR domain-containing protein n=1 Tax=Pseudorhodoferax sp. LjRoot39 TaxID=3342328 RepID=UPI003ECD7BED